MPVLNFKGKSSVYSHHLGVPFHALEINEKKSLPPLASPGNLTTHSALSSPGNKQGAKRAPSLNDNLIIHGDNLHALKALLPRYAGKVKCIYIDPPIFQRRKNKRDKFVRKSYFRFFQLSKNTRLRRRATE